MIWRWLQPPHGLAASGKFWNEEFSEWLRAEGFHQSTADTTCFIKCYPDGSWVRLLIGMLKKDDLLADTKQMHAQSVLTYTHVSNW